MTGHEATQADEQERPWRTCDRCNFDTHTCPGCGSNVPHGIEVCSDCDPCEDGDDWDGGDECQHEWELRSEHDTWVCAWCQAETTAPVNPPGTTCPATMVDPGQPETLWTCAQRDGHPGPHNMLAPADGCTAWADHCPVCAEHPGTCSHAPAAGTTRGGA